jgi:hypothetical protein
MKLYNLKQRTDSLIFNKIDKLRNEVQNIEEKNNHDIRYKLAYNKTWIMINPIVEINLSSNRILQEREWF